MNDSAPQPEDTDSLGPVWLIRLQDPRFRHCVDECMGNPAFLAEVDRLKGTNLRMRGSPLELAIDKATGRLASDLQEFLKIVWDVVFMRLPTEGWTGATVPAN